MEEFAICIEYMLLNQNQVIVPGLGRFVVQPQAARYDAQEEIFLPPVRIVVFNTQELQPQDNEFLRTMMQIYDLSLEHATQKLNLWIMDFFQLIEDCAELEFGCIGTFHLSDSKQLSFVSSESGIASPDLYALDTFHAKKLLPVAVQSRQGFPAIATTKESVIIRLNRNVLKYVAAASVLFVLLFSFAEPASNTILSDKARAIQSKLFFPTHLQPYFLEQNRIVFPIAEEISLTDDIPPKPANQSIGQKQKCDIERNTPTTIEATEKYCIVMASAISTNNANRYAKELKESGFASARVMEGKVRRVVVGKYETFEEAQLAASKIRESKPEYSSAWVYKVQ